jgi:transcriptional regulator with XRE-family HTH domain
VAGGRQGAPGFDPHRLRAARERAGLTQSALAEAAQVQSTAIAQWETGRRVPQIETVRTLADALRLKPADLLDIDPDHDPTLQELRAGRGLSQAQAAEAAGVPRTTYSMIERGENVTLTPADASAIALALGVSEQAVRAGHARSRTRYLQRRPPDSSRRRASRSSK